MDDTLDYQSWGRKSDSPASPLKHRSRLRMTLLSAGRLVHSLSPTVYISLNHFLTRLHFFLTNSKTTKLFFLTYGIENEMGQGEDYTIQSNFNGSNIFGTMKICSRQG